MKSQHGNTIPHTNKTVALSSLGQLGDGSTTSSNTPVSVYTQES